MNSAEQASMNEQAIARTLAVDAVANRAGQLASMLAEAQERIKSLTEQNERQAEEIAALKSAAANSETAAKAEN